ncbi:BTB/POZ domain-containing protein 17 [Protopterus annectens]|uniref:BTB/POZ domain-containing protein 17 n=1 Tax=Protopterus annectens TaxID=7888 RepID=UPI001CFBA965|nr:BTB/POZ domain-containing protein 17 [Protopterus annectens]
MACRDISSVFTCWSILILIMLQTFSSEGAVKSIGSDSTVTTINHSSMLIHRLQELLQNGNSSDVTVKVHNVNSHEVKVFSSHYLVLTLQSPVFEQLLNNQTVLSLQEPTECAAVFEKFIRYLYCGEITITVDQAIPLHKLATKYQVSNLQQGVAEYMTHHLATESSQGHVVSWYNYAIKTGNEELQESCRQFLAWNLSAVINSEEWTSVSDNLMTALLQRSDLVIQSEVELFMAVEEWITRRQSDLPIMETVLKSIRYAMITPKDLFQIQKQSQVLSKYYSTVHDLLFIAFQFHSSSPLEFAKYFDVNCSMFIPRNYLSSSWGYQWIINNPTRDDRSISFQTHLGPSSHDSHKKVTWNALFSPRWLPVSLRSVYSDSSIGAIQSVKPEDSKPRLVISPAMTSSDFAGVNFQKTILVGVKQQGKLSVKHVYNFHQSTDEMNDFLVHADLQKRTSEYLIDNSLHLHIIIKPIYQPLIKAKK